MPTTEYLTIRERVVHQFCAEVSAITDINDVRRMDLRGNDPQYAAATGKPDAVIWEGDEQLARLLSDDYGLFTLELGVVLPIRPGETEPYVTQFLVSRWAGKVLARINTNPLLTEDSSHVALCYQNAEPGEIYTQISPLADGQTELQLVVTFSYYYTCYLTDPTRSVGAIAQKALSSLPNPNWTQRLGAGPVATPVP